MSCYLAFIGKDLDVDVLVDRTGMKEFIKDYKGRLISPRRNKYTEYASASIKISDADFDNFNKQTKDAEVFLRKFKNNLKCIADTDGVEYANINFGSNSAVLLEKSNQSFYFPLSLISICAELKIDIETTLYLIDDKNSH